MVSDGDSTYTHYSCAQLLEALQNVDRARFPKNHASILREIGGRPAPGQLLYEGGQVVELLTLPRDHTKRLLLRVVIALALFELAGAVIAMVVAIPFVAMLAGLVWGDHPWLTFILSFILEGALYIATAVGVAWAFLKWLLSSRKGPYIARLIRIKTGDT